MTDALDLAIVGAGPGGQAAAQVAALHGLRVALIDEQATPGGQIYRQPYAPDLYPAGRFGSAHVRAQRVGQNLLDQPGIDWHGETTVWGLERRSGSDGGFAVLCSAARGAKALNARRVLVAAGCHDMAVPFPGWTLPGVMGAGGIQALLKGQGVAPGARIVLAGTHPLMLVIAAQLLAFGLRCQSVIFAQSRARVLSVLGDPVTALRAAPVMAQAVLAYGALLRARIPVHFGQVVTRAEGDERLSGVRVARLRADGPAQHHATIDCDTLGFCYGFTPASELPRQIGATAAWSGAAGGWVIRHDERMQTDVPGLFVAGETTGIGGAPCARAEGHLAGLAIAQEAERTINAATLRSAQRERKVRRRFAVLLQRLADPGDKLLAALRDSQTVICRCETITADTLRGVLRDNPTIHSSDAAKLLSRCGMGMCQGRFCHRAVQQEIAEARQFGLSAPGPFAARLPVRPVPLSQMRTIDRG